MRAADTAWASGLFEGEGCISLPESQRRGCKLSLAMTDEDVVRRFAAWAGAGLVRHTPSRNGRWKPYWTWQVYKKADVARLLSAMLPYFGDRRRAKAEAALHYIAKAPGSGRRVAA